MFGPGTKCRCANCTDFPESCCWSQVVVVKIIIIMFKCRMIKKCQTIDFMILLHNKYDYAFCQGIYAGTLLLYAQEIAMNHLWSQVRITELCKMWFWLCLQVAFRLMIVVV